LQDSREIGCGSSGLIAQVSTVIWLLFAAVLLTQIETATAQIWVSSSFEITPNSNQQKERAYCSTSAINPATGTASRRDPDLRLL
jgi:hypothetical protein